jgi:hypothetical protein
MGLIVDGTCYRNSAAKFWPRFLDELQGEFPGAAAFELSAPGSGVLDRRVLNPEASLAAEWERLDAAGAAREYAATVEELALLGPPAGVRLRVLGAEVLADRAVEAIDAETFPYLLGWLMEWAAIAEPRWCHALVSGQFEAEEPGRGMRFAIAFDAVTEALGEGLVRRVVTVRGGKRGSDYGIQDGM